MNLFKKILPGFFLLFATLLNAQLANKISLETKTEKLPYGLTQKVPLHDPVIGLALSGGGARGLAQIGVLKAFDEAGIQIDLIAGTSIGSIIGGAYASGYSVEEMDSIVARTDWNRLLSLTNTSERRELFVDQKIAEDRSLLTLRLDGLTPIIPTSFNEGIRLSNYLTLICLSAPVITQESFDDLLIKYRAVCTNLVDGNLVVLSSGSLARAMRASSSVSFLLAPVIVDTLTLVDGGLVSNIPVGTVREMGADYIIAVNTTSGLRSEEELVLPWNVADQTVSIPMKRLEEEEVLNANYVLTPELNKWSSTTFSNIDSLVLEGYEITKKSISEIKIQIDSIRKTQLGLSESWYKNIKRRNNPEEFEKPYFEKYFTADSVSNLELYSDLCELYKSGRFDSLGILTTQVGDSINIRFIYSLNPTIKKIDIISNGTITDVDKSEISNELLGKPFEGKAIFNAVRNTIMKYKKQGYILFNINSISFNEALGTLTLEFSAGTISAININSQTSKTVISSIFSAC